MAAQLMGNSPTRAREGVASSRESRFEDLKMERKGDLRNINPGSKLGAVSDALVTRFLMFGEGTDK